MSTPQQGDPSSTAFDLFDRWMTNREVPAKDEEPTGPPAGEVVIADTKSSREAARALLEEAARLEREGLSAPVDATAPIPAAPFEMPAYRPPTPPAPEPVVVEPIVVEPVAAPAVVEAIIEPVAAPPVVEAIVEPVVEAAVVEPVAAPLSDPVATEPVIAEPQAAVFELPAYRPATPEPATLTVVPDSPPAEAATPSADILDLINYRPPTPAVETAAVEPAVVEPLAAVPVEQIAAPVEGPTPAPATGGKRRAPVEPDSLPAAVAPESEGRRRRHAAEVESPTQPALPQPVIGASVFEAPVAEAPVVETPVVEEPVVETPVIETPVVEAPVAEAAAPTSWQEKLAQLATAAPVEPTYDDQATWADPIVEDLDDEPEEPADSWDPLTSPLRPQDLETQPEQSFNLRLIVNVVMLIALVGAGTAAYFLFKGEHWALRPAAALTALGTFVTTARFTG